MAIVFGVNPGGKNGFAVAAMYYSGALPVSLLATRAFSGVDEARADIVGTVGEWGTVSTVAIDAPLTWSGSKSGFRPCDMTAKQLSPAWAPKTWHRAPNALPGSVSVQGPALAWALASEIKVGQLPQHTVVEANPRLSLALATPELQDDILGVVSRAKATQRQAIERIVQHFVSKRLVQIEATAPSSPEELEAFVCGLVALGVSTPASGFSVRDLGSGEIRPVGARPLMILEALPRVG